MIKIGVVGANAVARKGISGCIAANKEMEVLIETDGGIDLLAQLNDVALDVVVWTFAYELDFEAHLELLLKKWKVPVLFVDAFFDRTLYLDAKKTMRFGYFTEQHTSNKELNKAILKLKKKGYYYDATLPTKWKKESGVACAQACFLHLLSNRQLDVAKESISGKKCQAIGEHLFISLNTVETHRTKILQLTNCSNFLEVNRFLLRYGFLSVRDLGIRCVLGWMLLTFSLSTNEDWFGSDEDLGTGGYDYVMPSEG